MNLQEALDIAVQKTGVARFRELLDPSHPDYNPSYERVVMHYAGATQRVPDQVVATNTVSADVELLQRMKGCPHRLHETECGCGGLATCKLDPERHRLVNHQNCMKCLREQRDGGYPGT